MRADGYFGSAGGQKEIARDLYEHVVDRPLISLHGYVNPRLFADPNATFGTSADLFFIPTIMLRVCCIRRAFRWRNYFPISLGVGTEGEGDAHREIWKLFCENFHLSLVWMKNHPLHTQR